MVVAIHFYADHLATATRQEFQRDASRTREKIESLSTFKVDVLHQHIEDVLLGKVRCRTGLESTWYVEVSTLIFPCNDSHLLILISSFFILHSHLPLIYKVIKSYGMPLI